MGDTWVITEYVCFDTAHCPRPASSDLICTLPACGVSECRHQCTHSKVH